MHGINLNSVLPMRREPSETSEMVNQLLFGEHFTILERIPKWCYVHSLTDTYEGWVDAKMVTNISDEIAEQVDDTHFPVINRPIAHAYIESRGENILLPGGSLLPFYNPDKEFCSIMETDIHIARECVNMPDEKLYSGEELLSVAFMFLNSPYLWGGRNALGIDCSGFVQTVFRICGIELPRDASQQVEQGTVVNFLQEARPGDLAFFENDEGRIIHVGILASDREIVHASGRVKIEQIDSQGIRNEDSGQYSHKLRVVKRLL